MTMTIELSKTQAEALQSGAAHEEGHITLPATLRGGARQKVLASLIVGKLAAYRSGTLVITATGMAALGKTDVPSDQVADYVLPEDAVVEQPDNFDADLGAVADAARVGVEALEPATAEPTENYPSVEDDEPAMSEPVEDAPQADSAAPATTEAAPADSTRPAKPPRANTKQARLIEMLKRPDGATITEIVEALQWEPHTVRGAIAGTLKKKLGLKVESEKADPERGRAYHITE